jgi:plastocyanin
MGTRWWLWLVLSTGSAHAANVIVNVGGARLLFSPQTVTIQVGDTVTFVNKGGFHNVVADDNSFRCARGCDGQPNGNGNPSNSNWVASLTFNTPGTIGYFCEVHGAPGIGMYGTIQVNGPTASSTPEVPSGSGASGVLLALLLTGAAGLRLRYTLR